MRCLFGLHRWRTFDVTNRTGGRLTHCPEIAVPALQWDRCDRCCAVRVLHTKVTT